MEKREELIASEMKMIKEKAVSRQPTMYLAK